MSFRRLRRGIVALAAGCAAGLAKAAPPSPAPPLPADPDEIIERLPERPGPHWLWVSDLNFAGFPDGRAHLLDGDTGRYLGMLNTGIWFISLTLPAGYQEIYAAETYYSRHARGTRTDVVTIYDPATLAPKAEVPIPP